jgi:PadR family transcriptional regulator, regulatory protein PadR
MYICIYVDRRPCGPQRPHTRPQRFPSPTTRMTTTALSYNAAVVLQALANGHGYGFEIMRATDLPSGTVYPLLRRLEAASLVASRWEDALRARDEGRPPRRYYEPTPDGRAQLAEARSRLSRQRALFGAPERPAPEGGTGGGVA